MTPTWVDSKVGPMRLVWWRYIGFGWLPMLTRNFYGGGSTVFTWGSLWLEWTPYRHAGKAL